MTIGRRTTIQVAFVLFASAAGVALTCIPLRAAPAIEVELGFQGHVVPERYAPIRVRIRGYDGRTPARLLVVQTLGSEWRDTSIVRQELGIDVTSDGVYEATLPVYEPLNPVHVSLVAEDGRLLAETSVQLRATRHLDPFVLRYGPLPPFGGGTDEPVVAADLPSEWWAYDAVRVLWIAAPPSQEAWSAIGRWALSGGSVVLAAGPDYFRFDSPILRSLLPLSNPTLAASEEGTLALSGSLRSGASISVSRGDLPLLTGWRYGAGHVAVLTTRPADLSAEELEDVAAAIPDAVRLSMIPVSESVLRALPVIRPTHLSALLLIALTVAAWAGIVYVGRRYRRTGAACAAGVIVALVVWSGFFANRANEYASVYSVYTSFHLSTSFGLDVASLSFFAPSSLVRDYALAGNAIPLQAPTSSAAPHPFDAFMPQTTATPVLYAHTARPGRVTASSGHGELKTFLAFDDSRSTPRLSVRGPTTTLEYAGDVRLADCWLIVDGQGARMPQVTAGTTRLTPGVLEPLGSLVREANDPAALLLQHAVEILPLHQGVWFIGISELQSPAPPEPDREVRHLDAYVVRGDVS